MVIQTWTDALVDSFWRLWGGVAGFLPSLVGALVAFIVGLVVASALGSLVERLLTAVKLDSALAFLNPYLERSGLKLRSGRFFGQVVFWFLLVVFLLTASEILGLFELSNFLRQVLLFVPNIVVAVLIMVAALMIANFLRGLVKSSASSAKIHSANFLGSLAWWAVVLFGLFAVVVQLRVDVEIINTLVTGLVAMLALAGGIAFGLGGKDYAAHLLERLREQFESRHHH